MLGPVLRPLVGSNPGFRCSAAMVRTSYAGTGSARTRAASRTATTRARRRRGERRASGARRARRRPGRPPRRGRSRRPAIAGGRRCAGCPAPRRAGSSRTDCPRPARAARAARSARSRWGRRCWSRPSVHRASAAVRLPVRDPAGRSAHDVRDRVEPHRDPGPVPVQRQLVAADRHRWPARCQRCRHEGRHEHVTSVGRARPGEESAGGPEARGQCDPERTRQEGRSPINRAGR